jgi:predicted amidophosphoribosyltransferase
MHTVTRCLINGLKSKHPYLCESLASFLFLQFDALAWPCPDLITYIPTYSAYFSSPTVEKLAGELGRLMQRPSRGTLKKRMPTLKQHKLPTATREALGLDTFSCIESAAVKKKTVLIIDDFMTTGRTLDCASYALLEAEPKRIYGLTLGIDALALPTANGPLKINTCLTDS